jgi:hypothetical protein
MTETRLGIPAAMRVRFSYCDRSRHSALTANNNCTSRNVVWSVCSSRTISGSHQKIETGRFFVREQSWCCVKRILYYIRISQRDSKRRILPR